MQELKYIEKMPSGKRIMLDPTYHLYFVDDSGDYVSVEQLREGIICGVDFHPNGNASYNGGKFDYEAYKEYMTKNLFRFNTNLKLDDAMPDVREQEIELVPKGYTTDRILRGTRYVTNSQSFWNV